MRKERQREVIERLLAVQARGEPEAHCREGTVAVDHYTSPARLEAERRVLFRELPIIAGRASEIAAPGAFFTHDAAGVPLLVTRDPGGEVRAFFNVCRHRGTRLVSEERGVAKAFVCRYHAWTYDLCGRLGHVPLPAMFPTLARAESGLVELPCEVRHGFVWVVPSPRREANDVRPSLPGGALDVAAWLGPFDDDLAAFGLAQHAVLQSKTIVRRANWKLVMDAFLEGYHVKSLHQRTLARYFADEVVVDLHGDHVRSVGARRNLGEAAAAPKETWDVRASTTVFYTLFPNTILVFHPETVSHIALFPAALDQVEVVHTMLVPHEPADDAERDRWMKTWALIDGKVLTEEDLAAAESIQSVLHANAQPVFQLGRMEHPIQVFHDAIDRRLSG
jgi:Rieske 2Fe-2S family protein